MIARHEFTDTAVATAYGVHATGQEAAAQGAWEEDLPFIDRFIAILPPDGSVLDVGAGSGNQARYFAKQDLQVSITDGTAEMLAVARRQAPRAQARVGVLPDIPFADKEFDGVFSRHVLQHLSPSSLETSLSNMDRVLRPKGYLALVLAVSTDDVARQRWWNIGDDDYVQINHHPVKVVRGIFSALGLATIEEELEPRAEGASSVLRMIARK